MTTEFQIYQFYHMKYTECSSFQLKNPFAIDASLPQIIEALQFASREFEYQDRELIALHLSCPHEM